MANGASGRSCDGCCGLVRCTISQRALLVPAGNTWFRGSAVKGTPYPVLPVVGVQLYRQDAVVIRQGVPRAGVFPCRADVKEFSRRSRRRLAFVASNTDVVFTSMITLTYPREFPNDGKDVKRNLNAFFAALRRKMSGVSLLWFLEFQRRGAPHIHIMVRGIRVYKPMQRWVSETWYRICDTGDLRHLAAGTRLERVRNPNGARNYCVKYAYKMRQKRVPTAYRNVGRFWGNTRDVKPVMRCETQCTNDDLVGALQAQGWRWLTGDVVRYHTLYGASEHLTRWLDGCILVPSTSRKCHSEMTLLTVKEKERDKVTRNARRRVWSDDRARLWDGGSHDPRADADRCRRVSHGP